MREQLREKMAGEIVLSVDAGKTIRKWREEFGISQQELAKHMVISPSTDLSHWTKRQAARY
jgi:putative transcriptional regulator